MHVPSAYFLGLQLSWKGAKASYIHVPETEFIYHDQAMLPKHTR